MAAFFQNYTIYIVQSSILLTIYGHLAMNCYFLNQNENYYHYISGYSTF